MLDVTLSSQLKSAVPDFKIGVMFYSSIVIGKLPALIGDRLPVYYNNVQMSFDTQPISAISGIQEWRQIFKKVGTDPSRYRPSQEALLRKIKKDGTPHFVHSAVDLINFFSVQYSIPMGIYDAEQLDGAIQVRIGTETDQYDGLNGRLMHMNQKIISADRNGAFGSPIVDSKRTCVTPQTTQALQLAYVRPSMDSGEAQRLIEKMAEMFTQVHGGTYEWKLIQ
ncbi:phenylalanine--tRNA ligase beta subunit-related protein [Sporolactobacillus sp. CPB3-1]|uniref:Phenylalanine--tRNA ligase beta subunit-related protein n=1 Tax=Sporolactobacillus mangiferae TaxID=2940498 RepID=A0ABT0M7B0_9BACL|nr:phenylalanine--tRNA ligase beta subunit-related protein [Sporolactobacillus mangiferae]MCL1630749.1 phenylalanine--tRNA ligase beta subunit-related protein [Sporolactobacillus mangiferae]